MLEGEVAIARDVDGVLAVVELADVARRVAGEEPVQTGVIGLRDEDDVARDAVGDDEDEDPRDTGVFGGGEIEPGERGPQETRTPDPR